jgi:salicylate biosynthesis isochorismate synthase
MKPAAVHSGGLAGSLPGQPSASRFLDDVLRGRADATHTVAVSVPAPVVPAVAVWRLVQREPSAFLWEPPEGAVQVGWGACHTLAPTGTDRGAAARRQAQAQAPELEAVCHPEVPRVAPRWWGGLSFAPSSASGGPWSAFGDGRFVLPRWCYGRQGGRAWLTVTVDAGDLTDAARAQLLGAFDQLADALATLAAGPAVHDAPAAPSPATVDHLPRASWDHQVCAVRDAIAGGAIRKVVVARCSMVRAGAPIDAAGVLSRLGAHYPGCIRFALRCGDATFLGATPERLVSRRGTRVVSEAMAGSVPRGASASLLASDKDRREHDLVVAAIVEALTPFCTALDRRPAPEVHELPNVVHLRTPVSGRLSGPAHVLDLLDALHPTPAVGGVPVDRAVSWILAHEAAPRGWYSGPVGWFDASGDGEFAVALRSGLLQGAQAWAYAGAGIVEGSTPEAEYAETALKLRPMLDALGAGGDGAGA